MISLSFLRPVHLADDEVDQIQEAGFLQMHDGLCLLCRLDLAPKEAAVCFPRRSRSCTHKGDSRIGNGVIQLSDHGG